MAKFFAWSDLYNGGKIEKVTLPNGGVREVVVRAERLSAKPRFAERPPFGGKGHGADQEADRTGLHGEMEVPEDAYYGASTQRAVLNFPVSGLRMPRRFISALGRIKGAAARVNRDLGLVDPRIASALEQAARDVAEGKLDPEFMVDVFQSGSGTSSNMNANGVIANRAAEILGAPRGSRHVVHPNDHANLGQSSNDVIPQPFRSRGCSRSATPWPRPPQGSAGPSM